MRPPPKLSTFHLNGASIHQPNSAGAGRSYFGDGTETIDSTAEKQKVLNTCTASFGLRPPITAASIKRGYRVAAKKAHPDAPGGSQEKLIAASVCKEVLLMEHTGRTSRNTR